MKKLYLISVAFLLAGCMGAPMNEVMTSCEKHKNFSSYVNCIKNDYTRHPDSSHVRSLYARLDLIDENYRAGRISPVKARAQARIAYDETVGAYNLAILTSE